MYVLSQLKEVSSLISRKLKGEFCFIQSSLIKQRVARLVHQHSIFFSILNYTSHSCIKIQTSQQKKETRQNFSTL